MKRCENCFEQNSDGATHCVICGESMTVVQIQDNDSAADPAPEQSGEPATVAQATEEAAADPAAGAPSLRSGSEEAQEGPVPASEPVAAAPEWGPLSVAAPADEPPAPAEAPPAPAEAPVPTAKPQSAAPSPPPAIPATPTKAAKAGVRAAIEVYHDSEPRVVHSHSIVNDITLIGREDPQRDTFPDLDLGKLEQLGVSSKRASREHLRVLRQGGQFFLYIYRGSTGTQVNKEVIDESRYAQKFAVQLGDRIILGGKVRLKLAQRE